MVKENTEILVGLDIGTSKVIAVVVQTLPSGRFKLLGLGNAPSNGLKRGIVINIDATVQSIKEALREAELMADCKIQSVHAGITGAHIRGFNSSGMVAIKHKEVSQSDIDRVFEMATAVQIPSDQRRLLVASQGFEVDGHEVKEPIGMSGLRLESRVHIVTGAQSAAENIIKCVRRCGLEVNSLSLNPLASSEAVLSEDERELGVVLVDIGAGTTDVSIFAKGSLCHTGVIPIAGDLITSDIAMALRTSTKEAEDIKVDYGCAKALMADPDEQVHVNGLGDREPLPISRQVLASIIGPRVEEIFLSVYHLIRESGLENSVSSGIVLTGGAAVMPGMVELAEDIFIKPVRRGIPHYDGPLADMVSQPNASTVMGLLELAHVGVARDYKAASKVGAFKNFLSQLHNFFVRTF